MGLSPAYHRTVLKLPSSLHVLSFELFVEGPQGIIGIYAPMWEFSGQKGLWAGAVPETRGALSHRHLLSEIIQRATVSMGLRVWEITHLQCSENHSPEVGGADKKPSFAFLCLVFPLKVAPPGHLAFPHLPPPSFPYPPASLLEV